MGSDRHTEAKPSDRKAPQGPSAQTARSCCSTRQSVARWRGYRIHNKLDSTSRDVTTLIEWTARLVKKSIALPQIEKRLQNIERNFWIASGIFLCLAFISRIVLPDFDITIMPKS